MAGLDRSWMNLSRQVLRVALLVLVGGLATVALAADEVDWPGTTPEDLSQSPLNRAWQPSIAAGDTGTVVVAWSDERTENVRDIYAVDSSDNGRTWSDVHWIAASGDNLLLPGTAVVGDRCFISWSKQTGYIFNVYERELGTGVTRQVPGSLGHWSPWPRLEQDGDKLHIVFHGGGYAPDILYATRFLTSSQWLTATTLYTHTGAIGSFYPALAIEPGGDTLHVVWEERARNLERSILYMEGDASGPTVSWSPPVTLSTGITLSVWPSVVADSGGEVYVVWGEQVNTGDVEDREHYYVRFIHRESGGTWSQPERIDSEPVEVNQSVPTAVTLSMALLEDDGHVRVCVAWHGFREGDVAEEVLLSCSTDQGQTWSACSNMSRTSGAEATSIWPAIAFDGAGELHGVWQERAGTFIKSDYQIYHTRHLDHRTYLPLVLRRG
jgi:hypothetical protein